MPCFSHGIRSLFTDTTPRCALQLLLFSTSVFGFSLSFLVAAACAGVTAYILQGLEMSPGLIAAAVAMVGVTAWLELAGLIANLEGRSVAYAGLLVSRSAVTLFIGLYDAYQ